MSTNGNLTNGTTSNLYAGGLRINGSDYNSVWGGWTGITATTLKGSATIHAGEWLRSIDTSSQRLFFASDGTTLERITMNGEIAAEQQHLM